MQVAHGVQDGQQGVLLVEALALAGGAQVVVRTHGALEARPQHRALAAVTRHPGVQQRGVVGERARVSASWGTHVRVSVRPGEREPREPVRRGVSPVLLSFWRGETPQPVNNWTSSALPPSDYLTVSPLHILHVLTIVITLYYT